jgi:hypothetical protein
MALDLVDSMVQTVRTILASHGAAIPAVTNSFAPGDFSVHFFLQLAVILIACRVVGWLGQKYLAQPQVVGEMKVRELGELDVIGASANASLSPRCELFLDTSPREN